MNKPNAMTSHGAVSPRLLPTAVIAMALLLSARSTTFASNASNSASWDLNPGSNDWTTATNWTPNHVPNGPGSKATFNLSNVTAVSISTFVGVDNITFSAAATKPFTITVRPTSAVEGFLFIKSGFGIVNRSGITQNFVVAPDTAGHAGLIRFLKNAMAGSQTAFTNFGALVSGGFPGFTEFTATSTADSGTFTNNGSAVSGARGGEMDFFGPSTAAGSTLIANKGINGGLGGTIRFFQASIGGTARVEVFGNGNLDISGHDLPEMTIGSVEGDGDVFLGANNLNVGSNNLSNTFTGVIRDGGLVGGIGGSLSKTGRGRLVLTGANTYTGGTIVNGGNLFVNNTSGSGTGGGAVQVNRGRLGGTGTIAGAVTVGTATGSGAFLAPGESGNIPGTLSIQSELTFNVDATYKVALNSETAAADEVIAHGVTINSGAQFSFKDTRASGLPLGTVFTVINNTSVNPIAGTFSNLPDGSTFTSNGNNFNVNYEGGTGNDLTLTVQ